MPDLKQLLRDAAAQGATKEQLDIILNAYRDNLKKKDQPIVSKIGGYGSQLGSQTFQPTNQSGVLTEKGKKEADKAELDKIRSQNIADKFKVESNLETPGIGFNKPTKNKPSVSLPEELKVYRNFNAPTIQKEFGVEKTNLKSDIGKSITKQGGFKSDITENIQKVEEPKATSIGQNAEAMFASGVDIFGRMISSIPAGLLDTSIQAFGTPGFKESMDAEMLGKLAEKQLGIKESYNPFSPNNYLSNLYRERGKAAQSKINLKYGGSVVDAVSNGDYSEAGKLLALNVIQAIPVMAGLIASRGAGASEAASLIGLGAGTQATTYQDLKEQYPNIDRNTLLTNSILTGLGEAGSELVGTSLLYNQAKKLLSKGAKKEAESLVKDGVKSYLDNAFKKAFVGSATISDASGEMANQLWKNFLDKETIDPNKQLLDGVLDAGIVSIGTTAPLAGGVKLADRILNPVAKQTIAENSNKIQEINKELDNPDVNTTTKALLLNQVSDLTEKVNDAIDEDNNIYKSLDEGQKEVVNRIADEIDGLTESLQSSNISEPTKELLKGQIETLNKQLQNALQKPSTTSQVPPVTEGGQNIQEGGEGVGQGVEGTQAPQEAPIQEPTAEIKPEEKVTYIPTEEQNKIIEKTVGNQQKGTLNTRWADWFLGESKEAKSYISDDISKNKKLQDAMKSKLYDEWKKVNNSDISFDEFLNSEIDLFRGGVEGNRNEVNVDGFNSWELTEEGAKKFAKGNPITKVKKKVKDLYGIVDIVGGELEVLEPTKLSEDYAKRVFESQEMTDKMFDNLSIDEQKKVTELSKNNKYNEALNLANYLLKSKQEAPQEISPEEEVARLRAEEQAEYAAMDNPNDERKAKEIYDRYDKLITPLLRKSKKETPTKKVVAEPVKEEAPKVNKEVEILESNLLSEEIAFENAQEEIENLKYELKDEKARIKQAISDVRKSNLSRADKEDKIEDLKYELEDFIDTHDSLVENYREDMADAKKEIAKINKKLKKITEAPAETIAPVKTKAKGVSATNKSQLADLKSRVTDAVKAGVVQTAERAINTLKSIFPDFDIVIHEDEDSYNKTTGNPNTRGNFTYYVNPDGTYTRGTIDINLSKANERTVAHEVAHAVLLKSFGENPKLFKTFRDKISKVLNSSRNAELIKFSNLYEGDVQAEEYLAELTAILEQQQDKLSPNVLQQIAAYINDLVSKLTNGAIKPFENVKDTKDIIDFFNAVSKSIREGEAINETDIKAIQEGASANIGSPTTINKSQKGEAIEFPDKPLPLSFVTSKDKVDIRALINEIVDKKQKVWFWMADQLGRGDYYDAVIDGKHYLDAGPSFALDPKNRKENILWASGVGRKALQDKINEADYIFFISGSPEKAKLFNRRVLDLVAERINVNSDFKSFKNAINSFGVETNDLKDIKSALDGINSFEELAKSPKRKPFLIAIDNIGKNKTMKPGSLKELLNGFNVFVDYNELRDGFYKENGFNQNDIMLVGKPTGLGGKAPHSTYENAIIGEVIGVPDVRMDSWNIMPQELRDKYKAVILGREEKTKPLQTKVIAAEIGQVRELEGQLPVSKSQQIDEELSKASGTTQRSITTSSYVRAANELNKLDVKGRVLDYGAGLGLGTDAMSNILGKPVESYEINPERWRGKKSITYTKSEDIDGKFDGIVSLNVINVVPRNKRDFIVQDIYNHLKDGGKAIISSRKFKDDIDRSKNFKIGPEEKSYLVKSNEGGKLIDVYQKGFDGDELVDYIKEVLGNKVDIKKVNNKFGASGVIIEKLPVSKSQKIQEEDNREALRVAGLPYLENTLEVLSAKFGMPYKVVYNETSPSTGSIDYINYDEPTIVINTANATNDTPLIQYGNIFINQIKNTNKNLFSGLVKQVLNTKEGQAELELAKERYSNDFYEDQVQQAIVSLLAKYAKNQFDPKTGIHKAIKKVWDTILDFLSKSFNVNINEIPPSTTMEQLAKILSNPNISINKTTYIDEVKEEIVEDSKRALEKRKKEYSEIKKIPNPSLFKLGNKPIIANKKQFEEFYNIIKEIVDTLKNYKNSQLLVDLTNIKSQISSTEARKSFRYDRYPLFSSLLKFIHRDPEVALWSINYAIENGENIQAFFDREVDDIDEDLDSIVYNVANGYRIGKKIGIEPIPIYNVYSYSFNSVDEVKAKLENDIESLSKSIENPELGADYYRRSFYVPIGDDDYKIAGNYRDGNISIEFSSNKYGMSDANEGLFFKVLPKVIDAISYMYSDVDYNTISFIPIFGESSKGSDLRLKGYNIFAKRLFGDFSLVAQNDNTTIIPIPEIFKNKLLKQERTVSRSQKVEGEEQAPKKGGPLTRIKQAIEKSRAGKTSVGVPKKPLEFDEFELVPREKVAEDLRNSIETPFRNEQALKTKNDSFIKRVVHNFMKASTDRKYSIVKEIVKKGGDLGELVRATIRNSKGYTGKASHIIRDINSKVFDKLSINPNLNIAGTRTSERELFDTFLNLNRIINIDNRITEKFSELVGLSNKLKKGFKDKSLSQEQLEELGLQIAKLKDYLANRKSLKINGIDADTKLIGEQGEEYIPYNSYRDVLRENYEPKQYKHSGNRTYQSTKAELNLIKETYPEVYKKFEDMSMKYYDAFRTALDDQYKNGLISKEVYDDLYSYNYIPTKYIEKLIEDQISLESPAQAAKLSSSIKNLSGGSEGDVLTNFQGIMDTYLNGTYKRIYDNTSAKTLSEAVKSASNSLGFKIQQPNGRARNGKETYAPMPVGMDGIYFFEDGVKSRIIVPKQFADEWYGREFNLGPSGDAAVIALKRVFLTNIFKAFTTKYNPLFGVLQVLVDAPQAIIASNAYPDLVLGSLQLAKDYKTVAPDIVQLIKNNKLTPLMEEAIDAGIFSDFLSTENDLFKTETLVKQNGTIDKVKYAKYLRDRVSKAGQNVLNKLAQFNEGMEYATRLAVYSRVRKNLIKKFNKENPGKELSEKDMFRITQLASAESRGIIDFSVNGTWGGTANKFLAYLNPAIQGFASAGRALKNNPWKTSVLLGEIGVGAVGVLAYSLGAFTGDDDEKRKRYAEYMQLSPYQRMNYFNIYNPLAKDEDRKWIKLFRKVQPFKGWANLMEQTYLASEFGAPISPSQAMEAFKADLPVEADMEQLITKAPLVNAYFKYYENRDAFRKEPVVQNEELIADWAEGRGDKNVGDMWKNLGEITKGKIGKFGPDGMQGLSPVRTQAAIQAIIGDPSRNPTTGVLDAGTKAMFYAITGDKEAMNREFSSDIGEELMKRTGLESRMFAKPSSVDYEYQKQLEGKRLTKFTKRYNIKADINNIYNSVENPKDADKEVVNYLLPLIKDGEITKDYAKKIMNSKTKIQVAKTLAPWADDLIFAQDTDEQIDLINYYTKESSDKKFAETLVILKGYGIINKDVANAASLERTKPKK